MDTKPKTTNSMTRGDNSPKMSRTQQIKLLIGQSVVAVNVSAKPPVGEALDLAARTWDSLLSMIPTEELEPSLKLALSMRQDRSSTFPVSVSEILNAWKEQRKPAILTSSEAWAIVVAEVHRVHYDGKPEFGDPLVTKVVKQLGWHFLCMNETAATRFEWAWKEEANAYSEKLELDPNYQLPGSESNKLLKANAVALLADGDISDAEKEGITKVMGFLGIGDKRRKSNAR